jgi:hypothetical protein
MNATFITTMAIPYILGPKTELRARSEGSTLIAATISFGKALGRSGIRGAASDQKVRAATTPTPRALSLWNEKEVGAYAQAREPVTN